LAKLPFNYLFEEGWQSGLYFTCAANLAQRLWIDKKMEIAKNY